MSSATLNLQTRTIPVDRRPLSHPSPSTFPPAPLQAAGAVLPQPPGWLRRPGLAGTALLHGAALLALWNWSGGTAKAPAVPPVVELIRLLPAPPLPLAQPKPEPVKDKVALAPPKPVARPQPQALPRTVDTPDAKAETTTPPAAPVQAAPIGPMTPTAPAPAPAQAAATIPAPAPAAPKQIATEGIPTDYVTQVYARINSHADYPAAAKLRRQQGKVGYRLTLNQQGALLGVEIVSSGVEALDQAARDAIARAAPFPRLPDLGGSSYLLAGNIVFKIN